MSKSVEADTRAESLMVTERERPTVRWEGPDSFRFEKREGLIVF